MSDHEEPQVAEERPHYKQVRAQNMAKARTAKLTSIEENKMLKKKLREHEEIILNSLKARIPPAKVEKRRKVKSKKIVIPESDSDSDSESEESESSSSEEEIILPKKSKNRKVKSKQHEEEILKLKEELEKLKTTPAPKNPNDELIRYAKQKIINF
jgi:hypothetical protein